ncbi:MULTISPECIES: plasmid mobilization relaxosome protein MobC [Falsihalocynthiibacter]|uniref:plasmid mobilization relaxosome protein MobC n=1 Tax=Falsihalocynthiibacter TaxID=2854182 RepID=UPI0030029EFC
MKRADRDKIETRLRAGESVALIAKIFEVNRTTIWRVKRRLEEQKEAASAVIPIALRASRAEVHALEAVIERSGSPTKSAFLRSMLRKTLGFYEPEEESAQALRDVHSELSKVGANINQIAKAMNRAQKINGKASPSTQDLAKIYALSDALIQLSQFHRTLFNHTQTRSAHVLTLIESDDHGA